MTISVRWTADGWLATDRDGVRHGPFATFEEADRVAVRPDDPMHKPGARVRTIRAIVDADYDYRRFGTLYAVDVGAPVGVVAEYASEADARELCAAYLDPNASRASVVEVRERIAARIAR